MERALEVVSIIISIVLIVMILLQVKGNGLGGFLGTDVGGGIARTRRGLEKTLFQITIALAIVFMTIAILSVSYSG